MERNPHLDGFVIRSPQALRPGAAVAILIHGRGQTPDYMLEVANRVGLAELPSVALRAAGSNWYPNKFTDPLESNQPALEYALERVQLAVDELAAWGIAQERIALVGFSQGACLASEFVYRNPGRWGALVALTGGLIGPEGTGWNTDRSLKDTPVFIGNGDSDPWVPLWRSRETADVLRAMGAVVAERVYPGREHTVCDDEIAATREILARL